jgi:hypothetical protein
MLHSSQSSDARSVSASADRAKKYSRREPPDYPRQAKPAAGVVKSQDVV